MTKATDAEIKRFMKYVDKLPNGCWFWTGGRSRGQGNRKWYGSFWFRGKSIRAHNFSCDWLKEGEYVPLPFGHNRDHNCFFSLCVNPEHVEAVPFDVNEYRKQFRFKETASDAPVQGDAVEPDEEELVQCRLPPRFLAFLKDQKLWPFDEPDYSADAAGVKTVGYGCS